MNYQKLQKIPKKIQTGMNKMLSEKPHLRQNTNKNYVRQQNIDVLELYSINKSLSLRAAPGPRLDKEDRLAYIRSCKAKLGLNDDVLLKSSKRTIIDSALRHDMPALEFSGFFRKIHGTHLVEPHEMHWSTFEFNKESNIKVMEKL